LRMIATTTMTSQANLNVKMQVKASKNHRTGVA
jgi:hypothetical protein